MYALYWHFDHIFLMHPDQFLFYSFFLKCNREKWQRRQWHRTPVLLPRKSHEWRSLVGYSPQRRTESDMTEQVHFRFSLSCTWEGNGNPLQYSCLENPRDRGAWWAAVYGVAQSRTRLKWLSSRSRSREKWKYKEYKMHFSSVQFIRSVGSDSLTPHKLQNARLPVHHQLPEFTQTHVHRVGDAIQQSHPLSSPSPPAPYPSQHQSFPMSQLFTWGGQSIGVSASASVLPKNTQDWSP